MTVVTGNTPLCGWALECGLPVYMGILDGMGANERGPLRI